MNNVTFGMLLLSIITGWLVVNDLDNAGPGAGIILLAVETVVAALWLLALVLKGMGFIS
jgi:hypothetical protein